MRCLKWNQKLNQQNNSTQKVFKNQTSSWFKSWFDTKYYHILYKNRDYSEAETFLSNLLTYLQLPKEAHFLDLACGKGRHAIFLNKQGYKVTGVDLSKESIAQAQLSSTSTLDFFVHDMREVHIPNKYKAVFNLFTSFGYFDAVDDNTKVLNAVYQSLQANGWFIIDFLNASKVVSTLPTTEQKTIDGITFHIEKHVKNNTIVKEIEFEDEGDLFHFSEFVTAFSKNDLVGMLETIGFSIKIVFGDYALNPFNQSESDRVIIVAQKITR